LLDSKQHPDRSGASAPGDRDCTDEELMGAYQRGDHGAFEELFARYAALVTGYMRRGYRSEHDAQDLTQQTFLHLHRGRHDYRAGAPLRPWLMTIARNVLRDRIRHERRRDAMVSLDDVFAGHATGAGAAVERRTELREALEAAMGRLPRTLGTLIRARLLEDRPYPEIARQLGISSGAAKVRMHRAVSALRRLLEEAGYESG
jgi:RNA polymerase sigma-70 factor (ECF subfamily)